MTASETRFRAYLRGALVRKEFRGAFADVAVGSEGVTLKGAESGFLHVPLARIAHVRVGFTESKYGLIYEAKIWLDGERRPLKLFPYGHENHAGYGAALRALAATLEKDGRLGRVYTGVSTFEALLGPVLMSFVVLFGLSAAAFAMEPPVWWHFIVIPLIPTIIFSALTWRAVTHHWPRPVASLTALDRQLP